ncbi:hypothetical protein [Salmonella phage SD-1_S14]|nr:hypothetical protein [Salmonella phage SD-1_S14]
MLPFGRMIKDFKIGFSHEVLLDSAGDVWGIGYNTQL